MSHADREPGIVMREDRSERSADMPEPTPAREASSKAGYWVGAILSALGIGACVTIQILGGIALMGVGGFVASGGPYEIAHPVPEGFWLLPVAFVGMFAFPALHAYFADKIDGFGLIFATWCAIWTGVGATTLASGVNPPGGGIVWGWVTMGVIFLVVGLGSTWAYVGYLRSQARGEWGRSPRHQAVYTTAILSALAAGVPVGFWIFSLVIG
jgi:hypothetical protein